MPRQNLCCLTQKISGAQTPVCRRLCGSKGNLRIRIEPSMAKDSSLAVSSWLCGFAVPNRHPFVAQPLSERGVSRLAEVQRTAILNLSRTSAKALRVHSTAQRQDTEEKKDTLCDYVCFHQRFIKRDFEEGFSCTTLKVGSTEHR